MIGAYRASPNYADVAKRLGMNAFNVAPGLYKTLDYLGQSWTANRAFLDASMIRGQQFFTTGGRGVTLARELDYLRARGVQPVGIFVRPPF